MTDSSPTRFQTWILECLQLAAYPAERQLREVRNLGVGVDEIALQLDDMVNIAMAHVANEDLPTADLELLRSVLAKVDEYDRTRPNTPAALG